MKGDKMKWWVCEASPLYTLLQDTEGRGKGRRGVQSPRTLQSVGECWSFCLYFQDGPDCVPAEKKRKCMPKQSQIRWVHVCVCVCVCFFFFFFFFFLTVLRRFVPISVHTGSFRSGSVHPGKWVVLPRYNIWWYIQHLKQKLGIHSRTTGNVSIH